MLKKTPKTTFHSLHREVRADRRRLAFRKLDDGWDTAEVAELVEVHGKTLEGWIRRRDVLEQNGFHGRKRGNPDDRHLLDNRKQQAIIEAIRDTTPDTHGVSSFLWSRKAVAEFIERTYGITLNPQRVSAYTNRWGLSPQKPKRRAYEQDPEKVKRWLEETYPEIEKRAKKEGAEIHWADETNISMNSNCLRTYAPKGKTPEVAIPARKTSFSLVSSLTNQGKLRYMAYKGGMNAKLFLVFLRRLTKDTDRKVFLIVDNLRVHHAKIVQAWQRNNKEKIELFFPAPVFPPRERRRVSE